MPHLRYDREAALGLRRRYEDGATVEQLGLEERAADATIRRALRLAETPMRPPGVKTGVDFRSLGFDGVRGKRDDAPVRRKLSGRPVALRRRSRVY